MTRKIPLSSHDADFADDAAEFAVAIPALASFAEVTCTGANVWLAANTSSGSLTLTSSPATKAIVIDKDWVTPVLVETEHAAGRKQAYTHFKVKPVAGAAGHLTINFFR